LAGDAASLGFAARLYIVSSSAWLTLHVQQCCTEPWSATWMVKSFFYDAESGLNYNVNRDYEPATGRYIQSDPIGLSGGLSTYGYGANEPLVNSDRFGLACPPSLKSAGRCFDSGNYNQETDGNRTVQGDGDSDQTFLNNASTLDRSETDENYGYIDNANVFNVAHGTGSESSKAYTGHFNVPKGDTKAICHSHSQGSQYGPMPGFADSTAVDEGHPNYIVRDGVAGVLEIVDGQYQYRLLKGRLDNTQRRLLQQQLNNYQHP
jgi:RHS repeat-associated protein